MVGTGAFAAGQLDSSFNPQLAEGRAYGIAMTPGGNITVIGLYTFTGAIFQQCTPTGDVDTNFTSDYTGVVYAVAVQPDGKVVFGAQHIDGSPDEPLVARLNANGTRDTNFTVPQEFLRQIGHTYAIAVQTDGKVLVAGLFNNTALWRFEADGRQDTNFAPVVTDSTASSFRFGKAIAIQPDGKIVMVGTFRTVNGVARKGIVRFDSDGSVDPTFAPGAGIVFSGSGAAAANALAIQPDGKIVVGGWFNTVNGLGRTNVARFNADGTVDATFDLPLLLNGAVQAIALQVDGKIILGGEFTSVGDVPRAHVVRLHSDGGLDMSFDAQVDGPITAMCLLSDGALFVGGTFSRANNEPRAAIAKLLTHELLSVAAANYTPGSMSIEITTQPTRRYALEVSIDLTAWQATATNTAAGYSLEFSEAHSAAQQEFFRARLVE